MEAVPETVNLGLFENPGGATPNASSATGPIDCGKGRYDGQDKAAVAPLETRRSTTACTLVSLMGRGCGAHGGRGSPQAA